MQFCVKGSAFFEVLIQKYSKSSEMDKVWDRHQDTKRGHRHEGWQMGSNLNGNRQGPLLEAWPHWSRGWLQFVAGLKLMESTWNSRLALALQISTLVTLQSFAASIVESFEFFRLAFIKAIDIIKKCIKELETCLGLNETSSTIPQKLIRMCVCVTQYLQSSALISWYFVFLDFLLVSTLCVTGAFHLSMREALHRRSAWLQVSWPWCHKAGFARFAVCLWLWDAATCWQFRFVWSEAKLWARLGARKCSHELKWLQGFWKSSFEWSVLAITGMLPGCPSDKTWK